MVFTGKQLFEMGCPQSRIKLLVGREFESEEAARAEFVVEKKEKKPENPDSIFNFLVDFRYLPMHLNGNSPEKMSNSELRRLLDSGGVRVNGVAPKADDSFSFPIWELVFFPKSERKTTMVQTTVEDLVRAEIRELRTGINLKEEGERREILEKIRELEEKISK